MANLESLAELLDGLIVSQQMLVAWVAQAQGANPAELASQLADYRRSCAHSDGTDIVLRRLQGYAEQLSALKNGVPENVFPLATEGGQAPAIAE